MVECLEYSINDDEIFESCLERGMLENTRENLGT